MVLIAGTLQISWSALRRYFGQSRLTMASEDEVVSVTGYPVGAISPLGLPALMRILVDQSVLSQEDISIGSGERYATVILRTKDLLKVLGPVEIGAFSQKEKPK